MVPLLFSYFTSTFLPTLCIHHDNKLKFCPHCHTVATEPAPELPAAEDAEWAYWHHCHAPRQERRYLLEKSILSSGRCLRLIIVCQDFSRFETQNLGRYQVLIIVRYSYDPSAPDGLSRNYRLFVGRQEDKVPSLTSPSLIGMFVLTSL
jgi:hypothetical protein